MIGLLTLLPAVTQTTAVRRLESGDVERFHRYRSDPALAAYQGWSAMTAEEAGNFVDEMSPIERFVRGGWIQLGIADARDGALIGDVGIFVEADESVAEIGLTLCQAAQGLGHAARAIAIVEALVFGATPVRCIRAVTDARNLPSMRMLARSGFVRCHTYETIFKGEACTEVLFVRWRPQVAGADSSPLSDQAALVQNADPAACPEAARKSS